MNYRPSDLGFKTGHTNGDETQVVCPFHDDHSPSASFNTKTGMFFCYVCKKGMNIAQLGKALGLVIERSDYVPANNSEKVIGDGNEWRVVLANSKSAIDNEYLKLRKISNDFVKLFDIREIDDGILFPLTNQQGDVVGIQIRYISRTISRYMTHGVRPAVWPMHLFPAKGTMCLSEGIFGAIGLRRAGLEGFSTLGSSIAKTAWSALGPFGGRLVVVYDNDRAGHLGASRMAKQTGCKVVWPGLEADESDPEFIRQEVSKARTFAEILRG